MEEKEFNEPETNIKARIRLYNSANSRPVISIQEYNQIRAAFMPQSGKIATGDIFTDTTGKKFKVERIAIEVLQSERDDHLTYGVEMARVGSPMPYNLEVQIFLTPI